MGKSKKDSGNGCKNKRWGWEINQFLKAIEESYAGLNIKTTWPLNTAQMDSYFDVDEALDMYYRIKKLRKTKTVKEIAEMLPSADVIRIFLEHNAIIGLKIAKKLEFDNISKEERVDYTLFWFGILGEKVRNNIFCLDGKNILLDKNEIKKILDKADWNLATDLDEKRKIAFLTVMTNNLIYTTFFDPWMTGGFYIHGPYEANDKFEENAILLVREYHDLNPKNIWPDLEMPYKKMKILAVYKGLDLKINFINHPITKDSIADKLIAYKIYLDDKELKFENIDEVIELFQKVCSSQTQKVNSINDFEKIKIASKISAYLFDDFRNKTGGGWNPEEIVNIVIEKFGDKFIKMFDYKEIPDLEKYKILYDPRVDDY